MNNAIPTTTALHAAPRAPQPTTASGNEPQHQAEPASGERNPAQTDDSPDAILGYN